MRIKVEEMYANEVVEVNSSVWARVLRKRPRPTVWVHPGKEIALFWFSSFFRRPRGTIVFSGYDYDENQAYRILIEARGDGRDPELVIDIQPR